MHYFVLFDTLNPCPDKLNNLFKRHDFPILYLPTNATNPTGKSHYAIKSNALSSTYKICVFSLNRNSCIGYPSYPY